MNKDFENLLSHALNKDIKPAFYALDDRQQIILTALLVVSTNGPTNLMRLVTALQAGAQLGPEKLQEIINLLIKLLETCESAKATSNMLERMKEK